MTVFFSTTPHPSSQEEGTTGSVFPFIIHFDTPSYGWVHPHKNVISGQNFWQFLVISFR